MRQNIKEFRKIIIANSLERNFYVFIFKKSCLTSFLSNITVLWVLCLLRRDETYSLIFPSLDLKRMKPIIDLEAGA